MPAPASPLAQRLRHAALRTSHALEAMLGPHRLHPRRSQTSQEACDALRTEGVWVTTVEHLLGPAAPACRAAMAAAADLVAARGERSSARWRRAAASTDLSHGELLARLPALFMLGLDDALLAVAEHYLRVPAAYHGAVLRHSCVDGRQVGPRRWHRDAEDFHVLRTIVYLNDVDEDGGPFEYLPREQLANAERALDDDGMCTDRQMAARVPRGHWKRCTGPAGTVVIADTAQVFHHESLQRAAPRTVLMLGHSTRRPREPAMAQAHFPAHRHAATLARLVPAHQQAYVFGWRRHDEPAADAASQATTILGDFISG